MPDATPDDAERDLEARTIRRAPVGECTRCFQEAYRRVVLVTQAGGGIRLGTEAYRECGCGRQMIQEAP